MEKEQSVDIHINKREKKMKTEQLLRKIIREEIVKILEDAKDDMRINDIIKKAAGDQIAMEKLAKTMASRITDSFKAARRAQAAEKIIGKDNGVAKIFQKRAKELGW
jgi:hypothetical protein